MSTRREYNRKELFKIGEDGKPVHVSDILSWLRSEKTTDSDIASLTRGEISAILGTEHINVNRYAAKLAAEKEFQLLQDCREERGKTRMKMITTTDNEGRIVDAMSVFESLEEGDRALARESMAVSHNKRLSQELDRLKDAGGDLFRQCSAIMIKDANKALKLAHKIQEFMHHDLGIAYTAVDTLVDSIQSKGPLKALDPREKRSPRAA